MSLRTSTLLSALAHAESLYADGCVHAAAAVLGHLLEPYDPAMPCADRQILQTATLFAQIAVDDPNSLAYAWFAERNARTLLGLHDPLTVRAMQTLVAVYGRQDRILDAIGVCGHLVTALHDRREPALALTWRREHARLLHADGQCDQALDEITVCAHLGEQLLADQERRTAARQAVIRTTVMLATCGDTSGALSVLRRHGDLLPAAGSLEHRADESTIAGAIDALSGPHRAVCTRPSPVDELGGATRAFWITAVRRAGQR